MIDLHFHALPGIDDGPADLAAAVALVDAAAREGVEGIVATPHVNWQWPNSAIEIDAALRELRAALAAQSIAVEIYAGAEVALTFAHELTDEELHALHLGGGPWLLVEAPHTPGGAAVDQMLSSLQQRGHRIVLAHVERCPAFLADETVLPRLIAGGMLASITAGSLSGQFGRPARQAAQRFLSAGLVHNVSSDAHDLSRRPPGVLRDLDAAGLRTQADWLVRQVPRAILAGTRLPPAPAWPLPAPRGLLARLARRA